MPPTLFLFLMINLAILSLLWFCMNFKIELTLKFWLLWVVWIFNNIKSSNPWTWDGFTFVCVSFHLFHQHFVIFIIQVPCWIELVKGAFFVLFLIFREEFSLFHCWVYCFLWACPCSCSVAKSYLTLCGSISSISSLVSVLKCFCYKNLLSFFKHFFCMYWGDYEIFILHYVSILYHTYGFVYVEPSLYSREKSHLVMLYTKTVNWH